MAESSPYRHELTIASTAVQHCAVLTQHLQRHATTLSDPATSTSKPDFSPVTIGDFAVQALLTSTLHAEFPDDTFVAEESADELRRNSTLLAEVWQLLGSFRHLFTASQLRAPESEKELLELLDLGGKNEHSAKGRLWVFDPIDGTATFMRGGQYAINCAFLVDGVEQLGILGCPNLRLDSATVSEDDVVLSSHVKDPDALGGMLFAARGYGTHVRPMRTSTSALLPSTPIPRHGDGASISSLIWSDCSNYTSTILPLHRTIAASLGVSWPGLDLFSSLMKYAALGLGRSHICIRIFKYTSWRSNIWDHAGGVLIFEEAGGKVTDLNGRPMEFWHGRKIAANYGLVCAPSSVHARVLAEVKHALTVYGTIPERKEV